MLRIFKSYHFQLNNPLVKAYSMSYSARPGDLESKLKNYIYFNKINFDFLTFKIFFLLNLKATICF